MNISHLYRSLPDHAGVLLDILKTGWARRDSNTRSSPCEVLSESAKADSGGFGASLSGLTGSNEINGYNTYLNVELHYNIEELQAFTQARVVGLSLKSKSWIHKSSDIFLQHTAGTINQNSIKSFYDYTISQFKSKDSWGKLINFAKGFLKYLGKTHFNPLYEQFVVYLEIPKTRKVRKAVTDRIVTEADILTLISQIMSSNGPKQLSPGRIHNYVAITLLGAYTGQRIESTIKRITIDQLRCALASEPKVIHVLPTQDKIRMEHYVPVHPILVPLLQKITEDRDGSDLAFEVTGYQVWLKKNKIRLKRVIKDFTPADLRKFAEQYGDVIGWEHSNRAYIMTHGVSGVDWSHYKHPLPEHVYDNYMKYWGTTNLYLPQG